METSVKVLNAKGNIKLSLTCAKSKAETIAEHLTVALLLSNNRNLKVEIADGGQAIHLEDQRS